MPMQYKCKDNHRRIDLLKQASLNGIDFVEIASGDHKTLAVNFFFPLPGQAGAVPSGKPALTRNNILIEGGVRVRGIRAVSVNVDSHKPKILIVTVNSPGDFSNYTLQIVTSQQDPQLPDGFDPQFASVDFSFKAECPSEFDCAPVNVCPPAKLTDPPINYLAKDYETFRQLMLDRMAVVMPDWTERNAADLGIVLVETMAYAADYLSYFQDATATEAYLGTARRRVSVRRHARLLDYRMHDGSSARAWVAFSVDPGSAADSSTLNAGTRLLTKLDPPSGRWTGTLDDALRAGALVFETLTDVTVYPQHNEIHFYTWDDQQCCLPKGATRATLDGDFPKLKVGDVLILEEVLGPDGSPTLQPTHRQAVRLTSVTRPLKGDPLNSKPITEIAWGDEDALAFPLCISSGTNLKPVSNVSVIRGNVALASHGQSLDKESLDPVPATGFYRPTLKKGPVTQEAMVVDGHGNLVPVDSLASASAAMQLDMDNVLPSISVQGDGEKWFPQRDLLSSTRFDPNFVVETEDDGSANLRFGDNVLGRAPGGGAALTAQYRIGNGTEGNVGAEAIAYVIMKLAGISKVRNPLPAQGGQAPETLQQVRLYAPQAFRKQERAVTEADYAAIAQRNPLVQKAVATLRWTGSWYTMFITADRKGADFVDAAFRQQVLDFFDQYRLAGYDIEVEAPQFVPLDIAMSVCVTAGYFQDDVDAALLQVFSSSVLPDGSLGFFHPDNFTFGQPVYLSKVVAAAMAVPGVHWVEVTQFQRWGEVDLGELAAGVIKMGRLEIARLDNDSNEQENGKIEFTMKGGV
jgi:Baseplate J-like protein